MSQLGNLSGDVPFTGLGDGNAGWWTRARLARKGTEPVGTSYWSPGNKRHTHQANQGEDSKSTSDKGVGRI